MLLSLSSLGSIGTQLVQQVVFKSKISLAWKNPSIPRSEPTGKQLINSFPLYIFIARYIIICLLLIIIQINDQYHYYAQMYNNIFRDKFWHFMYAQDAQEIRMKIISPLLSYRLTITISSQQMKCSLLLYYTEYGLLSAEFQMKIIKLAGFFYRYLQLSVIVKCKYLNQGVNLEKNKYLIFNILLQDITS